MKAAKYPLTLGLLDPFTGFYIHVSCRIVRVEPEGRGDCRRVLVETMCGHRSRVGLGSISDHDGQAVSLALAREHAKQTAAAIEKELRAARAKKRGRRA